jgi:hypothetical protein
MDKILSRDAVYAIKTEAAILISNFLEMGPKQQRKRRQDCLEFVSQSRVHAALFFYEIEEFFDEHKENILELLRFINERSDSIDTINSLCSYLMSKV